MSLDRVLLYQSDDMPRTIFLHSWTPFHYAWLHFFTTTLNPKAEYWSSRHTFLKMGHSGLFFFIFVFSILQSVDKILPKSEATTLQTEPQPLLVHYILCQFGDHGNRTQACISGLLGNFYRHFYFAL